MAEERDLESEDRHPNTRRSAEPPSKAEGDEATVEEALRRRHEESGGDAD